MIEPFALERYFALHEFTAPYLLSSSDCDGLPARSLVDWMDEEIRNLWSELLLGYTESSGHPLLRAEIASLYHNIDPNQVLVVTPEEGIYLTMRSLLREGDHVVCTHPGYQSLYEVARAIGCTVSPWQPDESRGWQFDLSRLEDLTEPKTKLLVINFPHNPTGALPSRSDQEQIFAFARERGIRIFSDEMYRLLELDGEALPSAVELDDRAIALFGLSKSFGLAGLRIGWLVTKDDTARQAIQRYRDYTTICCSGPSEILGIAGLRAKERILQRHHDRLRHNRRALARFVDEHADFCQVHLPRAGTVCFPRLLQESAGLFCDRAVQAGIMIVPSTVYDYGDQHIRIGLGRENLPQVLDHLARLLE